LSLPRVYWGAEIAKVPVITARRPAVLAPILLRHKCCAADPDLADLCASAGCQMSGR
jgi:hypothetical protein